MNKTTNLPLIADYALIGGFFVVMLAIGCYYSGRMRDMKDYFSGGNRVPWWLAGISYWMTSFSAFAFVAHSAIAYKHGMVVVTMWWTMAAAIIVAALLVAARWRRVAVTSPMEFIETRYGAGMRQGLSYLGSVLIVLDDATKVVAVSIMVSVSLGFPTVWAILACGLIMLVYTFLGGIWAVLVTDMVQFFVMLIGVVVLACSAMVRVGSLTEMSVNLPQEFFHVAGGKYTVAYIGIFSLLQFLSFCTRWSLVQRFYAVPRDADARKVCYLAAGLFVVVSPVMFFPAMAAAVFLPGVEDADHIYGLLCHELLPAGMLGMVIAGMFSATMSSLSGDYNAVASVLTTDVYKRLLVPEADDRHYVLIGRLATLLVGLITVGIALLVYGALDRGLLLFDLMVIIFAIFGPPTMIPVFVGLLYRGISSAGAICGMIAGIVACIAARIWGSALLSLLKPVFPWLEHGMDGNVVSETTFMVISMVSTILGLAVGSLLWPGSPNKKEMIRNFLTGLRTRESPGPASQSSANALPLTVVGVAVATLGGMQLLIAFLAIPIDERSWSLAVGVGMLLLGLGIAGMKILFRGVF